MYKLVERDGREYGPLDLETLRQWIAQGRIVPSSKIQDLASGVRLPAVRMRELRDAFEALPARGLDTPAAPASPARRLLSLAAAIVFVAALAGCFWFFVRPNLSQAAYTPDRPAITTTPRKHAPAPAEIHGLRPDPGP